MSIVLKGRFVHRLIEPDTSSPNKSRWIVDKVPGDWGNTVLEVCSAANGLHGFYAW